MQTDNCVHKRLKETKATALMTYFLNWKIGFMFESDNQEKMVIDNNIPGLFPFYFILLFHFLATVVPQGSQWIR